MITTTTATIPNAEITEIISVVHNRMVLEGFSFIGGGRNYSERLEMITNKVLEELKEKARTINADALVGLNVETAQIWGNSDTLFSITAIATAVKLNKQVAKSIE